MTFMINKIIPLIICSFFIFKNTIAQVDFTDSNLPIIVINTNGQTILDDPKIDVQMGIIWNGDNNRNFLTDPFNDFEGNIGIEIRGSTSQQYPKKSYGFETRDVQGENLNVSLLGLPTENDWILYGAYPDKSLMRNEITYSLFEEMQPWSPRYVYCELVINGEYLGVYTLLERIKRDKDRVDIEKLEINDNEGDDITGGYIIKVDKLTGSSNIPWISEYQEKVKFLYHDPEYEELSLAQREYISNYVSEFENAVYSPDFADPLLGYRPFINTASFVDFMIMQELGRTVDGYRSSSFMYKDRDSNGGKLTCGPMWDFNLSFGNADYCDAFELTGWQYNFADVCPNFTTEPPNWWARMLEDPTFTNELKCRWQELRSSILATENINNWIDSTAFYLTESQERNFTKWPILGQYVNWNFFIGDTFQEEVDYLKSWFQDRSTYLDGIYLNYPGTCEVITSTTQIRDIKEDNIFYPNPTHEFITSKIPITNKAEIKIFDPTGNEFDFILDGNTILLNNFPKGIYLIKFQNQYYKIIKA